MAVLFWVTAAISALSAILSYLGTKSSEKSQQKTLDSLKPNKGDLTYSEADIARLKKNILGDLLAGQTKSEKNIKQVGAAKRLPSGAIGTQLAENKRETNRAIARVEPELNMQRIQSNAGYQNLLNQYGQGILNFQQNKNLTNQAYLGNLSKIFMLWQGGYFNNQQQPMRTMPNVDPNLDWSNSIFTPSLTGSMGK